MNIWVRIVCWFLVCIANILSWLVLGDGVVSVILCQLVFYSFFYYIIYPEYSREDKNEKEK